MDTLSLLPVDSTVLIPLRSFLPHVLQEKPEYSPESLLYIIGFLTVFAFIRLRGKDLLYLWIHAFFMKKKVDTIQNEGISQHLFYYILAIGLSFSVIAVGASYHVAGALDVKRILYVMALLFLWHIFALLSARLSGWIFNAKNLSQEAAANIWVFNILTGLLTAPLVFALSFAKDFAVSTIMSVLIVCFVLFYLFRLLRWFEIFLDNKVSVFYMILYLCVLEFLPMLTLYKVLG